MATSTEDTIKAPGLIKASDKAKGPAAKPSDTSHNLDKPADGQKVALTIVIDPEERRAFKMYAVSREITNGKLFSAVWAYYQETHG